MQIMELCRLPQRPSDLLEMRDAGYGPRARLALDLAVVGFANRFEALRQETVERPAPDHRNRKPTIRVPKYSERQLLEFLGIAVGADRPATESAWSVPLTDGDWDALWGEDMDDGDAAATAEEG